MPLHLPPGARNLDRLLPLSVLPDPSITDKILSQVVVGTVAILLLVPLPAAQVMQRNDRPGTPKPDWVMPPLPKLGRLLVPRLLLLLILLPLSMVQVVNYELPVL